MGQSQTDKKTPIDYISLGAALVGLKALIYCISHNSPAFYYLTFIPIGLAMGAAFGAALFGLVALPSLLWRKLSGVQ